MDLARYPVAPPKIVAVATDSYLTPTHASDDPDLPGPDPKYGQDWTFGTGRKAPNGENVGSTEAELKPKMRKLLDVFADGDGTGMAKRLFDKFLAKQSKHYYFDDADLNRVAEGHSRVKSFIDAALGANVAPPPGKKRIHQALQDAGWDISKLVAPTDLGPPAFNVGNTLLGTGDKGNGLFVMINGIQHVYVVCTHYHYDAAKKEYGIQLQYRFYDIFGLDDDDVDEYGADSDTTAGAIGRGIVGGLGGPVVNYGVDKKHQAGVGITAWWQLQHQHNYAPLVTRIVITKAFIVQVK